MTILVRETNGNGTRRVGIHWGPVIALFGILLTLAGIAIAVVNERAHTLSHVARGEQALAEWQQHKYNAGPMRHLTVSEYQVMVSTQFAIKNIDRRLSRIENKLGIEIPPYNPDDPETETGRQP